MAKPPSTSRRKQASMHSAAQDTPPSQIPLPSNHRETTLPIHAVGGVKFEELCCDVLMHAHPCVKRKNLKRRSGLEQFGVDVEGFNAVHEIEVVISCKCRKGIKPKVLLHWTNDFVVHLDCHWKGKGVKVFILAITHPGNSDELNKAVRACHAVLQPHGIAFELWDDRHVTDLLRKDIELVDRYFNEAWVKAISPKGILANPMTLVAASSGRSAGIVEMARELAAVSRDHDALTAQKIDDASAEYRAGRAAAIVACLDALQHDTARWSRLDAPVKAKALRARAMLALNADDSATAGRFLDDADALVTPPDRSARAWYIRVTEGRDPAIAFLQSPTTPRELEILATLLLENGDPAAAIRLLDDAPQPSTPEQMRLRAIARCSTGEREDAVRIAIEASTGPAPSFAAVQSLATLHIMAALAPGAEVQFGAAPNPFNTALVRVTADAIAHLDAAINIIARQIPIVDTGHARDLELWQLAALLLHPTKTRQARAFAEDMLARPDLDPLAIAWCHSCGIKLKYWRVRKKLEADLQAGVATPSHVVVLAMLVADRSTTEDAAKVFAKHRPAFEHADDFLLGWQKKFEGDTSGDAFAAAIYDAERKSYAVLVAHLHELKCNANQLLIGAGFLAMRKEWRAVFDLRVRLVAVGTPRAVDLAARSAVETRAYSEAVNILDAATPLFADGQLSESLRYLRSRAYDRLGLKGAAIADLESAALRSGDPALQGQLIHSLISTGRLDEARDHARSYVMLPSTKPIELVRFANVFKGIDAEFSRSLIRQAADHPKLPKQAAPGLMILANMFGLDVIEGRMMALIADLTKDGSAGGIIRFEDVKDVIAFMQVRGDQLQKEYDLWHAGMKPAHVTFANDVKTFAALYLADPEDRFNALNKPLPMLVRAANAIPRSLPIAAGNTKPRLVVDISALLLAMRCNLLDVIESHYTLQIPEAVPLAIVEIEDEWPQPSEDYASSARDWLANHETAVQVVAEVPEDAVAVGTSNPPFELIDDRIAVACQAAIAAGEMSKATSSNMMASEVPDTTGVVVTPPPLTAVALEPWTLVRLQQRGLLEPIAKALPTFITTSGRDELAASLARCGREDATRRRLTALRERVGARLATGAWTTLPRIETPRAASKLSHHLQSLVEIIDFANAAPDTLIWVEDRALSRSRLPSLVNILDIASDLLQRGIIDVAAYWNLDRQLREMGVAFMPIPVAQIAGDVIAAPIVKGVLVETPDLTTWRCWYAQEIVRLGFTNPATEPDADGRITGEPRYMLDMLAAARNVLAVIWSDTASSTDDKRARSDWVWTCLRFEVSPAFQWSTVSDDARRTLMANVMVHTADLPLMARLNTDKFPKDAHQPFMDWFAASVLANRFAVDPVLGDAFAVQLAALIAPQLAREPNVIDELADQARAFMAQIFQRYLSLFPEEWRDRITMHHDLAAQLGFVSVMTLHVGGVDIPADAIEEAIASALPMIVDDKLSTVPVRSVDDRPISLALHREPSGTLVATITCNGQSAHLDPFLVAVTLPDTAFRLGVLEKAVTSLDLAPGQRQVTIAHIGTPDAISERVRRQQEVYDRDFVRRLDRIRANLKQHQTIELADLALPDPRTIAQYLRLPDPFRAEPGPWLDDIVQALTAELGLETAARRAGAIPFDLPETFYSRYRDEFVDASRITSAAHARVYLTALHDVPAAAAAREELVGLVLDRLDRQAEIMAALLWKGVRQLVRSPAWRQVHPSIAFALLCVWADRIASSIASGNADPEKAAENIRRTEPANLTCAFPDPAADVSLRVCEKLSDRDVLTGALVGSILPFLSLKDLPADLRSRLLGAIGNEAKDVWCPQFQIAFQRTALPGSWITNDAVASIMASDAVPVLPPFTERPLDVCIQAVLQQQINPEHPFLVTGILAAADLSAVSRETAASIIAYIDKLLIDYANQSAVAGSRHALCIRAQCLGVTGATDKMAATMAELASSFAAAHRHQKTGYVIDPEHSPAQRDLVLLLEMAIAYTSHLPGGRTDKVSALADLVADIPVHWKGARHGVIEFLDRSTTMLDSVGVAALWPGLLRARQGR